MHLDINGQDVPIDAAWRDEPLLWVLREGLGLCGAKYGCGVGLCGACTVLVDGVPQRACVTGARDVQGARIETVEGLAAGGALSPLQQAWEEVRVAQCGYCQAGQLMCATALLRTTPEPSDAAIEAAMEGNLCRCGTYQRIRQAIRLASGSAA